ncbi:MAG: hypothetical protein ABH837_00775 [bacterium]
MSIFEDSKKAKIAFISTLVIAIIFFLGSGVLGYMFYGKYNDYKNLKDKYTDLKEVTVGDLEKEIEDLQKQVDTLTTEKTALEEQIKEKDAGIATANAYNEFLKYMTQIIKTHNGFTGWTDAEYQVGRTKAQATGSTSFVNTVDWAWNRTDIDPVTRVIGVWDAVANGISNAI